MPANKYALLRYRIIDRKISSKSRPYPTKEALRQACEEELYGSEGDNVSLSTIDKDLYAMRNESNLGFYAPISFSKIRMGYYYKDPDYTIENMPLSDEEAEAIRFAAQTFSQFRGLDFFKSSASAIDKILDRFALSGTAKDGAIDSYVQFEMAPSYKGGEYLPVLLEAIKSRRAVSFSYEKYTGTKAKSYQLHPYLLKEYRNRWYVIGFNPEKKAVVVFALDRLIGDLKLGDEKFAIVPGFNPKIYFEYSLGITATEDAPSDVRLRFTPLTGKYIESTPLHHSQNVLRNDEVAFDIGLHLCITKELLMQVLSFGSDVEVMAPPSLKSRIEAELKKANANYAKREKLK